MIQPFRIVSAVLLALMASRQHSTAHGELRISGVFGNHMVVQRDRPTRVWGWADRQQQVTVRFGGQSVTATVGDDGKWHVTLSPMQANLVGRDLSASCNGEEVSVRDVLVGDVWHASGQSNMAMNVAAVARRLPRTRQDIATAELPHIRFRRLSEGGAANVRDDVPRGAGWVTCSPATVSRFSAVAFYFARKLHAELGVPIGVIDSSRGGTPIEPYIPRSAFRVHPTLRRELELGDHGDLQSLWAAAGRRSRP